MMISGVVLKEFCLKSCSSDEIGKLIVFSSRYESHSKLVIFSKKNTPGGDGTIEPKMEDLLGILTLEGNLLL
jgi:hypothetical protein